ncbi:MAG: TrkH family potassium uptake protein [Oscillospiraceae bacterium]
MNIKMVLYILGYLLRVEAALMALPCAVALGYGEACAIDFMKTIVLSLLAGVLLSFKRPRNGVIYARDGFVVVALSWIAMSAVGALPFYWSGEIPSYIDALFETVSGFTTTGASILTAVEGMSQGLLFWRSFTHWIGGMGVLVFILSVLPLAGDRSMHLMRAEVPGPTVGKLVPRLQKTAKLLYGIYFIMTLIEIGLLLLGGMPLFDSIVHSFGTAGTGGFGIKNNSIAYYNSAYIDGIIGVFMILFGINFNLYYILLLGDVKQVLRNEELRCYLGIIAASVMAITVNIRPLYQSITASFRYAFFQVASIITTTGYATADFDQWPELSRAILVLLMFCGACAGSTGGGIKAARLVILYRAVKKSIGRMLHPRSVGIVKFEGKTIDSDTIDGVHVFFATLMAIACVTVLIISLDGFDFTTNFTAMAACLNNVGPGLGVVGPTGNFSAFSSLSKLTLTANMLLGRLEIFPILTLFAPSVWKSK